MKQTKRVNEMVYKPRPKQQAVLEFRSGKMGVAAVPGSGKTTTLSYLAAQLINNQRIQEDQEVLIVTLVNAAVDNFSRQITQFIKSEGLLPNFGYRVRTLHGLANDIVRERPALVGLEENFLIVDEQEGDAILEDAVLTWVRNNPNSVDVYISNTITENEYMRVRNNEWQREVVNIASAFIKQAKDLRLMPEDVREALDRRKEPMPLAEMGWAIYVAYQRALNYRGAVDFQDLIRLALKMLELDEGLLKRLRYRWPYILEDEAQDSSLLQERILRMLVGDSGNWLRVGDPNQAIFETFTTANPRYLRQFLIEEGVQARDLPNSGRSTKSIMKLANALIDFISNHPSPLIRERLPLQPPKIEGTQRRDPQPNPKDAPNQIHIRLENYAPAEELDAVVRSVETWIKQNPTRTAAILVPRNDRGAEIVNHLKKRRVPVVELLRSTSTTRETAGSLALILEHLSQPLNSPSLAMVYNVWRRDEREDEDARDGLQAVISVLKKIKYTEDFVQPRANYDWLDYETEALNLIEQNEMLRERLLEFRAMLQRWHRAAQLPIDQLVLTLAQDIFTTAADLAIAYSLAVTLRHDAEQHPDWRLPQFSQELRKIAQNKRRVNGITTDDTGFDPDQHKGKVTVVTMHRAKGLEWDRVYLMSVNNYDFPSGEPQDTYISEKWYVRDKLNLQAEALEQLRAAMNLDAEYIEGEASRTSRADYIAERLRLLYVGITRARQELVITWNTGRKGDRQAAVPLIALADFWEKQTR
jgi:DNA helicase II / ATP-dependent DNA helicase PcrA